MTYYFKIKTGFFRYTLAYFEDPKDYLMDGIFKKNKLESIKFKYDELIHPSFNVRILFCTIKKKDLPIFEKCISDFSNKALILGKNDLLYNINIAVDQIKKETKRLAHAIVEVK